MENFYTLTIYLRWRLLTSLLIISWDTDQERSLADFFFFEVSKNTCSSVVSSILFCSKTFFFFLKKIFIYFWLCWVLVAVSRLLSSCGTQVPECTGSVVVVTGLVACRILVPGPGIEPLSPALEGGFPTTRQSRKSQSNFLKLISLFFWLHWVLVVTGSTFDHCCIGIVSCSLWGLVPWPGTEARPLQREHAVLATGLPGKSFSLIFTKPFPGFKTL